MAKRILNRKDLRADYEAAERRKQDEDEDEEDGDEEESDESDDDVEAKEKEEDDEAEEEEVVAPKRRKKPLQGAKAQAQPHAQAGAHEGHLGGFQQLESVRGQV